MAQLVKNQLPMWETWVQSWVGKIPQGMATHSSIIALKNSTDRGTW